MGMSEQEMNAQVQGATAEERAEEIATQAAEVFTAAKVSDPIADTGTFTEAETKQIEDLAKQINIRDTRTILNYGGGVQKKMADFSESVLQNVKTHDLGEVGSMLTGVIGDLKSWSPDEEEKGGLFGLFRKSGR
jgi:uncharacterized protein YaaN involved in tellurite resistance